MEEGFNEDIVENFSVWCYKSVDNTYCTIAYEKMKVKARKELFPNQNKKDLPVDITRERLERILGTKVSKEFLEWYRQDNRPGGFTTPGLKYQGPGNPTNIGDPVNYADSLAEKHDLQYAHASYRYSKNKITKEQFEKRITKIDEEFLRNNALNVTASFNPLEQVSSIIGTVGIGAKYVAEAVIGQQYPSTDPTTTFKGIPKEKTNTNLTNKLMQNLKNNISKKSESGESSSMDIDSTPKKRPAEPEEADTPTKRGAIQPAQVPPQLPSNSVEVEMANLTGTAKEQASGGGSSDGLEVYYIEKPISIFGRKQSTYIKSHKFMTFGLAPSYCGGAAADSGQGNVWLTSYLAEVPWHIPAFYLNQSEFDLIPNGSHITKLKVDVIYRGSTIQFETNASATGLATLNQINDIAVAHGLNRTGWGSNVSFTAFDAAQPMVPTAVAKPDYQASGSYVGMVTDYYSGNNDSNAFINVFPKHQIGRHAFLYNYWAQSARTGNAATAGFRQFGGWPALTEKIKQMDGKTVVNQVVASSEYKPKVAPIKTPLRAQGHGLPFPQQNSFMEVPGVNTLVGGRSSSITTANSVPTSSSQQQNTTSETLYNYNNTTMPNFDIYTPIEKSQYMKSGFWGTMEGHVQPSLHIGVQPVPALSTAALLASQAQFNNWTDTRAYWEVVATMTVEEYQPTAWPFATAANVPQGDVMQITNLVNRPSALVDPRNDGATFAGLYPVGVPSLET